MNIARYRKGLIIITHTAVWILLFSLPALLRPSNAAEPKQEESARTMADFIIARFNDLLLIGFFYLNAALLIPRLFYRKKYFFYILAVICCFALFTFISWEAGLNFSRSDVHFAFRRHLTFCIFVFLFILACSIAYKTIKDRVLADKLARERQNENLKTELSLLRSQVNPHFMFNVLNNMVALARKQSEQLEPSLIKLSSLMRYMLYETGEQKVLLDKETEYLQSYIDLQLLRFGKKLAVQVHLSPADKQYEIEPMLLIPFVENAFKHGTGIMSNPEINISLTASNDQLQFTVNNKYDPSSIEIKDAAGGIGLANVKRRLALLYAGKYNLQINTEKNIFSVSLQIQLH